MKLFQFHTAHRLVILFCMISFNAITADQDLESCKGLGFTGLQLCSDCNRLAAYVKEEGLIQECQSCCAKDDVEESVLFSSALLEVCKHRLGFFPEVQDFIKTKAKNYPGLRVKYTFSANPRIVLKRSGVQETVRIDRWKADHVAEFLNDKLIA